MLYNTYWIFEKFSTFCNKKVNLAIYPFGNNGKIIKKILNERFEISEAIIVDNNLRSKTQKIYTLDEVQMPNNYVWLLTCSNPEFRSEIKESLSSRNIAADTIIDLFELKPIVYSENYKALSKIGKKGYCSAPCVEFVELVREKKKAKETIVCGEIGVNAGATAVEVCKKLRANDTYYCFDFYDVVTDLISDLKQVPEICCHLEGVGNSYKTLDSYSWSLMKLLFAMRESTEEGIFDIVYLDGSHSFIHDGLSCCLLKELLKENGYLIFDDVFWSYGTSGACNPEVCPETKNSYTDEQINDFQVLRVIDTFMVNDESFKRIYMNGIDNPNRAVFKKIK